MWKSERVSVVLPTYNERDSIRQCIEEFFATGFVDEVVVVNNNAADGTREEVARTRAREVFEPVQGYGSAFRRGMREAEGDLIVVCEPDGTFRPNDIHKLLAYSDDVDYVIGTRTTREFVWRGANMGVFLKWGNWFVAKMAEFLFDCTILTDCGCTFRLIRRRALATVEPCFRSLASDFGLEMTLWVVRHGIEFVEVPVNYGPRVGVSAVTGDFGKTLALGLRMIALILRHRLGLAPAPSIGRGRRKPARRGEG